MQMESVIVSTAPVNMTLTTSAVTPKAVLMANVARPTLSECGQTLKDHATAMEVHAMRTILAAVAVTTATVLAVAQLVIATNIVACQLKQKEKAGNCKIS